MISDGYLVGDGSWTLRVYVTDMETERTLRVKGETHIGGVMLKLVEDLGKFLIQVTSNPTSVFCLPGLVCTTSLPVRYCKLNWHSTIIIKHASDLI